MSDGTPLPTDSRLSEFRAIRTRASLATWLGVTHKTLVFLLYVKPEWERYCSFEIDKKSGGKRLIESPIVPIRKMQEQIAEALVQSHRPRKCVHGFVRKGQPGLDLEERRSIVSNASNHARRRWVLNLDLVDFFHSIYFGRVRKLLLGFRFAFPDEVATTIAHICCYKKRLPQGAPTSPVISNLICDPMDGDLTKLARNHGCRFTRYCDDLTISTTKPEFPMAFARLAEASHPVVGEVLREAIAKFGFRINDSKTHLRSSHERQYVTGLTVNRKPNLRRTYVRQVRAMLHAWERYGEEAAQSEFWSRWDKKNRNPGETKPAFQEVVRGKIEFLGAVRGSRDPIYLRYLRQFQSCLPTLQIRTLQMVAKEQIDVFLCHASEDKVDVVLPIAAALDAAGIKCFLDAEQIKWGDSITKIISDALVKARYVVVVLSRKSIGKHWPEKEMHAALAQEISSGRTKVLPLLVGKTSEERQIIWSSIGLGTDKRYLEWTNADDLVQVLQSRLSG